MSTIVVGITAGGAPEPALDFAIEQALHRHAALTVVHAYALEVYAEPPGSDWPRVAQQLRADVRGRASSVLGAATDRLARGRHLVVTLEVVQSDAVGSLVLAAETAELLVVGSRGGGRLRRAARGSVSAGCLHHASVPVVVVPDRSTKVDGQSLPGRVLVGLDGSPASLAALAWGAVQARDWQCPLVPVIVCPSYGRVPVGMHRSGHRTSLRATVDAYLADVGCDLAVEPRYVIGEPVDQLRALVDPMDLLVVGSRGHGALPGLLLGSTSLSLAEDSPCPVVVVRAKHGHNHAPRPLAEPMASR